jgi:ElaB/YqjD/DUF883 family membrane-anchored ribosome-binding protein
MATADSSNTAAGDTTSEQKPDVEQLRADIEQTREELGETVEALTAKLDVKSRAKARVNRTKQQAGARLDAGRTRATELTGQARSAATTDDGKPAPAVLAGAAVAVSALVVVSVLVWRRRR